MTLFQLQIVTTVCRNRVNLYEVRNVGFCIRKHFVIACVRTGYDGLGM